MKRVMKKYIAILIIVVVVFVRIAPVFVFADDVPQVPLAPSDVPAAPTSVPTAPQTPDVLQVTSTPPQSPPVPTVSITPTSAVTPTVTPDHSQTVNDQNSPTPTPSPTPFITNQSVNGQVVDTSVKTGDSTVSGISTTEVNTNLLGDGGGNSASVGTESAVVVNDGNGATTSSSATVSSTNNTNQSNSANVQNGMSLSSNTGNNGASQNLGTTTIQTGNANTSGTAVTMANTNAANVSVSQFTIADDQKGDYVLDFAANCISNCTSGTATVANTDSLAEQSTSGTFQNNDATVGNQLTLAANSGNNTASDNTGGATTIKTGNATVDANSVVFANNNIAGNVQLGFVNIYGNLDGDIILPDTAFSGSTAVANANNGANTTNNADDSSQNTTNTTQSNNAQIANNLIANANTGGNAASDNTGGAAAINTGNTTVDANILNISNSNITGGNMWLVLVNKAGQWIGQILGAPAGQDFAGSDNTQFAVSPDGQITASNNGNGANSSHTSSISGSSNTTVNQTNNAVINNTLQLTANTGNNQANNNGSGNTTIQTGDATIVANMINFVNNNISGNGHLLVTVINVFGNWFGNFVAPGQKDDKSQTTNQTVPVATTATDTTNQSHNNAQANTNNSNTNSNTKGVTPTPTLFQSGENQTGSTIVTGDGDGMKTVNDAKVAGISTSQGNASEVQLSNANQAKMTLNLAWLLVLLPVISLVLIGKKLKVIRLLQKK